LIEIAKFSAPRNSSNRERDAIIARNSLASEGCVSRIVGVDGLKRWRAVMDLDDPKNLDEIARRIRG
jgi:hypothetical protein